MSRTILSLILAFGLFACISAAVSGAPDAYADDFIKKFAGKYYNSTNTTATAEDKNATTDADVEAAAPNPACAQTLNKTNDAVAQFAESVGTAKDKWSLLGSISRLSGQSYSLGFNCNPENLKLVNSGEVGVNKTQDEACDKLIEMIQPLLIKSKDDKAATGGFEQSLALSQKALGISKKLGDKCKVSLIDITQPEEEEVEVEEEIEEEEEEAALEESINEELEEEEESYDLIVQVVDEEGNLETIYYGSPDFDIDLTADSAEENVEQEAEEEEEEAEEEEEEAEVEEEEESIEASLINFVQTKTPKNKPNPNPNPNPWSSVDYKGKYSTGAGGDYSTGGAGGNYTALNAF